MEAKSTEGGEIGDSLNDIKKVVANEPSEGDKQNSTNSGGVEAKEKPSYEDLALEAAMTHAHEIGVHQGVTRAMVIRAYPK